MSSSPEVISIAGLSSPRISSTTAAASRRPTDATASRIRPAKRCSSSEVISESSHFALPTCSRSCSWTSQMRMISAYARSSASRSVSSGISSAPASTIVSPSFVPTTIRSSVLCSSLSWSVGLITNSPSIWPMRTAPTGPMKGSGEIISAAEAPLMQRMSCGVTRSADRTVQMTCTSLRKPFGQSGRIGRSIIRAVSVARSVARPSRLKKPPGILPAAYARSSTSTVSGKKSAPSRASGRPTAVARTIVSPERTTTAPSACLANLPVSKVSSLPPISTDVEATCPNTVLIPCPPLCLVESGSLDQPRLFSSQAGLIQASTLPDRELCPALPPEAQLLDEGAIALEVVLLHVVQEPPPPADELQQPPPGVVVLGMRAQVLGEVVDPARQHRDLNLGGAGVGLVAAVLPDQLLLDFLGEGHVASFCRCLRSPRAA